MSRLLSACALVSCAALAAAGSPSPVESIKALGGKVVSDPTRAGNPVLKVVLKGDKVADKDLALLATFADLRELDLSGARVTNAGLARLKGLIRLENLNLSRTLVTDEGLAHLRPLGNLRVLDLRKPRDGAYTEATRFTDKALPYLKAMPKLVSLKMDWNMLSDDGMMAIAGMKNLREAQIGIQSKATSRAREMVRRASAARKE